MQLLGPGCLPPWGKLRDELRCSSNTMNILGCPHGTEGGRVPVMFPREVLTWASPRFAAHPEPPKPPKGKLQFPKCEGLLQK